MASQVRYRSGDCKPVAAKTHASYPIEKGDLVFLHPSDGTARPASALTNQGSESLNQDYFQAYFLGVALHKTGLQSGETSFKLTTNPGYTLVATAGNFEFDCDSQAFVPGALVAVAADANGCSNQKVDAAGSESLAIGVARPNYNALGVSNTTIEVEIRSTAMRQAIEAQVAGSGSGV